ncbi:hypothetical protein [Yoonia sp. F2084L]|uniref:hypothetical protein n=1 Tax=Yoonia sp. F2084L TaxID=2926419 RepID=UPI001FF67C22|nr:hypothetical protein [Yoonia sp. F2084L]
MSATTSISYSLNGCVFQEVLINQNYCRYFGQVEGDRIITTTVDLREVKAISTSEALGNFYMKFDLDYGGPGSLFVLTDRLLNGSEGAFERFSEQDAAALNAAELSSMRIFSRCDGSPDGFRKQSSLAIITAVEPRGWLRLVELATECRAPDAMEYTSR